MLLGKSNEPAGVENQVGSNDQGQDPPPALENWQQMLADMQARMQRQDEEIPQLTQQQASARNVASEVPPVPLVPAI